MNLKENTHSKRILVDCSVTFITQLKTGVQKTVREFIKHKHEVEKHLNGYKLVPIIFHEKKWKATSTFQKDGDLPNQFEDWNETIEIKSEDKIFLPDSWWTTSPLCKFDDTFPVIKNTVFVMYDLIPVRNPEFVQNLDIEYFLKRLRPLAKDSLGAICISNYVKKDYQHWLSEEGIKSNRFEKVTWAGKTHNATTKTDLPVPILKNSFLMVGTVCDRKGHPFVLDTFEKFWAQGLNYSLHIVGLPSSDSIFNRIESLKRQGYLLHTYNNIPFAEVERLYQTCQVVICASNAEGFGLPLAEAMEHNKVVIANNLEIFHEVAGDYPIYFEHGNFESFKAAALKALITDSSSLAPLKPKIYSWAESADELGIALKKLFQI